MDVISIEKGDFLPTRKAFSFLQSFLTTNEKLIQETNPEVLSQLRELQNSMNTKFSHASSGSLPADTSKSAKPKDVKKELQDASQKSKQKSTASKPAGSTTSIPESVDGSHKDKKKRKQPEAPPPAATPSIADKKEKKEHKEKKEKKKSKSEDDQKKKPKKEK